VGAGAASVVTAVEAAAGDVKGAVGALACAGFTNVLGGAFAGGVASDLIFTRTFSAAWRSAIASQP
jgi:hypothetical protein